jgi:hypothetical protein
MLINDPESGDVFDAAPTARELLKAHSRLKDRLPSERELAARVEKLLRECDEVERMELGHGNGHPAIFVRRIRLMLDGIEP